MLHESSPPMRDFYSLFGPLSGMAGVLLAVLTLSFHVIVAIGIHRDAMERTYRSQPLAVLGPWQWTIVGLVGGLPALALYWLAHHSTLSKSG